MSTHTYIRHKRENRITYMQALEKVSKNIIEKVCIYSWFVGIRTWVVITDILLFYFSITVFTQYYFVLVSGTQHRD